MEISAFQRAAGQTSQLRAGGPQGLIEPMLGLASETGSILNVYKKYLRDGIDVAASREQLEEELGDLLWYMAAVATACGLDLETIARANLARTRDRYGDSAATRDDLSGLPIFDHEYPPHERFPRRIVIECVEHALPAGRLVARMRLVSAQPNPFADEPVASAGATQRGFRVGSDLGEELTDNSRRSDAYRFHDAIHLGFMSVLGWSPTTRALLGLKRKSDAETDEVEDGARAIFAEEGLAAILSRLAARRMGFLSEMSIDREVIDIARAAAADLEVEQMPGWLWRRAITHGFNAMHKLSANGGGYLIGDLESHSLTYAKLPP